MSEEASNSRFLGVGLDVRVGLSALGFRGALGFFAGGAEVGVSDGGGVGCEAPPNVSVSLRFAEVAEGGASDWSWLGKEGGLSLRGMSREAVMEIELCLAFVAWGTASYSMSVHRLPQ